MNGRLYDPLIGRMLSPDNYVQDPFSTQSYNRYSYVLNNPLKYTDPTGEYCDGCINIPLPPMSNVPPYIQISPNGNGLPFVNNLGGDIIPMVSVGNSLLPIPPANVSLNGINPININTTGNTSNNNFNMTAPNINDWHYFNGSSWDIIRDIYSNDNFLGSFGQPSLVSSSISGASVSPAMFAHAYANIALPALNNQLSLYSNIFAAGNGASYSSGVIKPNIDMNNATAGGGSFSFFGWKPFIEYEFRFSLGFQVGESAKLFGQKLGFDLDAYSITLLQFKGKNSEYQIYNAMLEAYRKKELNYRVQQNLNLSLGIGGIDIKRDGLQLFKGGFEWNKPKIGLPVLKLPGIGKLIKISPSLKGE